MGGSWLVERLIVHIPIVLSLTVHEWAHARAAFALGDTTAQSLGRMTLDPLAHIDPVGTLILPLLGVPFGWAKRVPVNPMRFHARFDGRWAMMLVAGAGPLSNLLIALSGFLILGIGVPSGVIAPGGMVQEVVRQAASLNVGLAVLNLLPIPPLDGSRVLEGLVPERLRPAWDRLGVAAPMVLAALLLLPLLLGFSLLGMPAVVLDWLMGG